MVIAVVLAAVWGAWALLYLPHYPSPLLPSPSGPRQQAELVVIEAVGGVRTKCEVYTAIAWHFRQVSRGM